MSQAKKIESARAVEEISFPIIIMEKMTMDVSQAQTIMSIAVREMAVAEDSSNGAKTKMITNQTWGDYFQIYFIHC